MGVLTKFISKFKGVGTINLKQCYFCRKKIQISDFNEMSKIKKLVFAH